MGDIGEKKVSKVLMKQKQEAAGPRIMMDKGIVGSKECKKTEEKT